MATATQASTEQPLESLIANGSADLHTVTTPSGLYRFVSRSSLTLFGWDPADLVTKLQGEFVHPDDIAAVEEARRRQAAQPDESAVSAFRFRCADGSYRWAEAVSSLVRDGEEIFSVSSVRDIQDRTTAERVLQRQASTDPLTGLANRILFMDRLRHSLVRLERGGGIVAVLFLDLDGFKLINDSVGHHIGDAVLVQMGDRLRSYLRPQDTLARLGGDEFAIVAEDMSSPHEPGALAARIIQAGRAPFEVGGEQFACTTSIGIATTSQADRTAEDLLQEADLALYRAKDRGRDRAEMFDEDLRTRAVGRMSTERMLRRAILEDGLRIEYQPIIDLRTSRTVSAEALVRILDPNQEDLVAAESFVDVAEQAGLLAVIDDWVLGQALGQASLWRDGLSGSDFADVAINVTTRHLADPDFARGLISDLAAHGLPTTALQVEMTERVLMEASRTAMTGLNLLHDAGVRVGLDDFGIGYSSLSYLRQFPLDFVKIDRSFVMELAQTGTDRAIVGSIIDLSQALGMSVVAEGVETQTQVEILLELGCDRAQGFFFGRSGPPEAIEERVLRPTTTSPGPVEFPQFDQATLSSRTASRAGR